MLKKCAVTGQMIQLGWKPPELKTLNSSCFSSSVPSMAVHLLAFLLTETVTGEGDGGGEEQKS